MYRRRLCAIILTVIAVVVGACKPVQQMPPGQAALPSQAVQGVTPLPHEPRLDAPKYAERGPYAVGVKDFVVDGSDRPLPLTVWYPAVKSEGAQENITYLEHYAPTFSDMPIAGKAVRDAVPDAGGKPYPLIVFSHGNSFTRFQSTYLLENLASHGFIVAAADHTGNNLSNLGEDSYAPYIYRPGDIERVIVYMDGLNTEGGVLAGLVDGQQVGVMGHSFGASTALRYAGAPLDFGWCFKNVELEKAFPNAYCETLIAKQSELAKQAGLNSVPKGKWPAIEKTRAKAVVALAPDYDEWGSEYDSVTAIKVPALVMAGTKDTFNPPEYAAYPIYKHLGSSEKALVTLDDANHLVFANACHAAPAFVTQDWYFVCSDPVWDMDRAHDLINHFVTAFFLTTLRDDAEAAKELAPESVSFPGINLETTGITPMLQTK